MSYLAEADGIRYVMESACARGTWNNLTRRRSPTYGEQALNSPALLF
jgi:hypothetical protein